ncbi:MFS transporter [Streptomyces spiroverticillatus]|uniref:MFS transporter n=1 Tax=Streptomyces finlayi TaxID=67296 RepID=A0A918X594_9ACTN|nr:MFS transporter [Streptomyces finlayi]GHA33674.1 MFS transporter [Streptomyces spiroverticillatus]GHD11401.1 MFS transporter [Streptomyces finlayi]
MTQQPVTRAEFTSHDPWRYRWTMLGVATFTQAASGFFVGGIGALGIHLQSALDLNTAQLGLLVSSAQLAPLVGLLVAGELLDRYGERWVVGIGAGTVGLALCTGSLAPGYATLLAVLLVVGMGYSTVQPGGSKTVASWFDASQRGFAMGIRQAGLPLGVALASAVLPYVAVEFGWRATLLTGGLVALLGAALFMGAHRRPPTPHASQPMQAAPLRARLRMLREPSTVKIMLSGISLISVQGGVGILTVLHLHRVASVGAGTAALVLVASQGAGVAGRICLAAWSDRSRSGRYAVVLVCMVAVIGGLAVLMTPAGRSPVVASGVFVWLGFFGFGWYGPWVAYVTEAAPPGKTGFALGLAMSVNQIAIVSVPPVLGLLVDLSGSFTPAWALLSLLTFAALAVTAGAELRTR